MNDKGQREVESSIVSGSRVAGEHCCGGEGTIARLSCVTQQRRRVGGEELRGGEKDHAMRWFSYSWRREALRHEASQGAI